MAVAAAAVDHSRSRDGRAVAAVVSAVVGIVHAVPAVALAGSFAAASAAAGRLAVAAGLATVVVYIAAAEPNSQHLAGETADERTVAGTVAWHLYHRYAAGTIQCSSMAMVGRRGLVGWRTARTAVAAVAVDGSR